MRFEKLSRSHDVAQFDCGNDALNRFLSHFALASQSANGSQTYVALDGNEVIGYYTLVVGEIQFDVASDRMRKGLARRPVPIMILARLGLASNRQGQGLGPWLLKDAILRTLMAADIAGIRAMVVHAKNEAAQRFYQRFGFSTGLADPLHLYVLTKDLKAVIQ